MAGPRARPSTFRAAARFTMPFSRSNLFRCSPNCQGCTKSVCTSLGTREKERERGKDVQLKSAVLLISGEKVNKPSLLTKIHPYLNNSFFTIISVDPIGQKQTALADIRTCDSFLRRTTRLQRFRNFLQFPCTIKTWSSRARGQTFLSVREMLLVRIATRVPESGRPCPRE